MSIQMQYEGTVVAAEFLTDEDAKEHEREAGTYITIRLDGDPPIAAGRVRVTYLDPTKE